MNLRSRGLQKRAHLDTKRKRPDSQKHLLQEFMIVGNGYNINRWCYYWKGERKCKVEFNPKVHERTNFFYQR